MTGGKKLYDLFNKDNSLLFSMEQYLKEALAHQKKTMDVHAKD